MPLPVADAGGPVEIERAGLSVVSEFRCPGVGRYGAAVVSVHQHDFPVVGTCTAVGGCPMNEVVGLPVEQGGMVPAPGMYEMEFGFTIVRDTVQIRVAQPDFVVVSIENGAPAVDVGPCLSVTAVGIEQVLCAGFEIRHEVHAVCGLDLRHGLPSGHGADGIFLYGDIFCVAQARVDILASVALVGMDGHDIVAVRFQRGKRFRGDGLRHIARGPSFDFVCFDTVKVDFAVVVLVEPELQGVDLCLRKVADGEVAAYVNIGCVPRAPYESVGRTAGTETGLSFVPPAVVERRGIPITGWRNGGITPHFVGRCVRSVDHYSLA